MRKLLPALILVGCGNTATGLSSGDAGVRSDSSQMAQDASGDANGVGALRPRLLSPYSLAFTSTRRPTFFWERNGSAGPYELLICRSRDCSEVERRISDPQSGEALTEDLAPGVHFWRVDSTTGGVVRSSATWEFVAPFRNASRSTLRGSLCDVNGDGYSDLVATFEREAISVAGGTYRSSFGVYVGSPEGIQADASQVVEISDATIFPPYASCVGDVNGDGFADVVLSGTTEPHIQPDGRFTTSFRILMGSSTGLIEPSVRENIEGLTSRIGHGDLSSPAGDVNGDGYGDVLVAARYYPDIFRASPTLYLGGPSGITGRRSSLVGDQLTVGLGWGAWVQGDVGDMDGRDGGEFAIATHKVVPIGFERISILSDIDGNLSAPTDFNAYQNSSSLANLNYDSITRRGACDMNGDGLSEFIFASIENRDLQMNIIWGSIGSAQQSQRMRLPEPSMLADLRPHGAACAGDVNGDGYSDAIWIGTRSWLLLGGNVSAWRPLDGCTTDAQYFASAFGADFNGDGRSDWACFSSGQVIVNSVIAGNVLSRTLQAPRNKRLTFQFTL